MKRMLNVKLAILAIIIAFGFVMVSCGEEDSTEDPIWTNNRNFSIRVSNYSKMGLVAFKGEVHKANLISGIPANQTNWGLKNDPKIFPATPTHFKMVFITKEQYEKNKNKLSSLNDSLATSMYVFWNGTQGDNQKVYEISGRLGGSYTLEIWNPSNFNVEFRMDGTSGPTLGFAQAGMTKNNLYVGEGDYLVYPVFQRINTVRDIVETVIPRFGTTSNAYFYEFNFGNNPANHTRAISLNDAVRQMSKMSAGAASLIIANGADTGVRFLKGTLPQYTPGGFVVIDSGENREFVIEMPKTSGSNNYADAVAATNYKILSGGFDFPIVAEDGTDLVFKSDFMYTVTVKGSAGADTLTAKVETRSGMPLSPKAFTMDEEVKISGE